MKYLILIGFVAISSCKDNGPDALKSEKIRMEECSRRCKEVDREVNKAESGIWNGCVCAAAHN